MTETTTERDVQREVSELRRAVLALREELDRRDVEQMEMEGVVEHLERECSTQRYVLGSLIARMVGTTDDKYGGKTMHDMLYPHQHPAGFGEAPAVAWRRPARRWTQFGSRSELVALAKEHGISTRGSRQWLIRDLWEHRVLPGSVALHRRAD